MIIPALADQFRKLCGYRFPRLGSWGFQMIMKGLPLSIRTELFPGIVARLDLGDETQRGTYWFGTRFEIPTPEILECWASSSDYFFDIGSNYGFFSFFLNWRCPGLRIYAFEPNPDTFSHLTAICAENHLGSIFPQPIGLSDCDGEFPFYQLTINSGHSSFAPVTESSQDEGRVPPKTSLLVRTQKFDDFIAKYELRYPEKPAWVAKIDVEGFEFKVLRGMSESLRRKAFKGLCVELVPDNLALAGSTVHEIDSFLRGFGYAQMPLPPVSSHSRNPDHHNVFYTL